MRHDIQERFILAPCPLENLTLGQWCFQRKILVKKGSCERSIKEISTKIVVRKAYIEGALMLLLLINCPKQEKMDLASSARRWYQSALPQQEEGRFSCCLATSPVNGNTATHPIKSSSHRELLLSFNLFSNDFLALPLFLLKKKTFILFNSLEYFCQVRCFLTHESFNKVN